MTPTIYSNIVAATMLAKKSAAGLSYSGSETQQEHRAEAVDRQHWSAESRG